MSTTDVFVAPTARTEVAPIKPGESGRRKPVNLLPAGRRGDAGNHYEDSRQVRAPLIAESRLAFECLVIASGTLDGNHASQTMVVARVLLAHQRWPRGCAIR
jgi:flavin reductase (DIM6/NTAB) family NADH-FMN oxidoreductase RutF